MNETPDKIRAHILLEGDVEVPRVGGLHGVTPKDFAAFIAGHFESLDHLLSEVQSGRAELVMSEVNPMRGQMILDLGDPVEPEMVERRYPLWDL